MTEKKVVTGYNFQVGTLEKENNNVFRIGVHTSIAGGMSKSVERAAALKCTTMQVFTHNPRQWEHRVVPLEEAERFKNLRSEYNITPVFSHASYLINLASRNAQVLNRSIDLLSFEMAQADRLGIEYVVLHTGSARGDEEKAARERAVRSIREAVAAGPFRASLVLENTAGEKGDITSSIRTLSEIMDNCRCDNIAGICVDTCHAFSAGYDLSVHEGVEKLMHEIDEYAGLDRLKLIHLNDSKRPAGSGVDRHEHIGKGYIGAEGFAALLSDARVSGVPLILETPKKSEDDDRNNMNMVFNILKKTGAPDK